MVFYWQFRVYGLSKGKLVQHAKPGLTRRSTGGHEASLLSFPKYSARPRSAWSLGRCRPQGIGTKMNLAHRLKEWMFSAPEGSRSATDIILWWELRRIPYNFIVGVSGLVSLLLFYFFISRTNALKPGEDAVEPAALLVAPVVMNLCYTAGWVVEACLYKAHSKNEEVLGPKLLRSGLNLSVLVVTIPAAYWGGYWLLQALEIMK